MRRSTPFANRTFPLLLAMMAGLAILMPAIPLLSAELYPGPYRAEILRVVDSDTVKARVALWPTLDTVVSVRLRGVDTPEKHRPQCPEEKVAALAATDFVEDLLPAGAEVLVTDVSADKYGGRVVGDLSIDGTSLSQTLIARGFARPYDGGTKTSWCPAGQASPERAEGTN